MADEEHLRIIWQGVDAWNSWRQRNPQVWPDLSGAELRVEFSQYGPDFIGIELPGINLSRTYLQGAQLIMAQLQAASFEEAEMHGTVLSQANLAQADFRGADLTYSDLSFANLEGANLTGADIQGTLLNHTRLSGADFSRATIGWTKFGDTDLSAVEGLETTTHGMPSTIGIDTIYKSKGKIPENFLRGAGVPDNFIQYMASLTGQAFKFYTCFISFTESDDVFAERLYNDLQGAGVRCWRWKEDAKFGKTLMHSIDEAVRTYDKLVIICSEPSLNSPAVIREIERALQKEDELARQGRPSDVLFPIRLDDYIFAGWNHHRKADVLCKNVGDFRQWHDPAVYRIRLDRLVRDLRSEQSK